MTSTNQTLEPGTGYKTSIASFSCDAAAQDLHRALLEDGTVIIEDLLDESTVRKINTELTPALRGPQLGVQDDMVVGRTRRLNATLRHSPTMVLGGGGSSSDGRCRGSRIARSQ